MKKFAYILFILTLIGFTDELRAQTQTASFGGSLTSSNSEGFIRLGVGDTLTITLLHGPVWADTIGQDNDATTALLNSIVGDAGGDWATVASNLDHNNVIRSSDFLVKIGLPAVADYDIYADEIISATLPASSLASGGPLAVFPNLTITHDPITATIEGTITEGPTELNIRENTYELRIIVTNDTLVQEGTSFDAIRTDILAGITGDVNWSVINSSINVSNVVRTDANTITITIAAVPDYYIGTNETVSVELPLSVLQNGAYGLGLETFNITNLPSTANFGGSIFNNNNETELRKPGATLTITLNGDEWVSDVGVSNPVTSNLLSSISGSAGGDWGSVATYLDSSDVSVVGTVLTITLPIEVGAYNIYQDEIISADIDPSALASNSVISVSPTLTIQHDSLTAIMEGSVLTPKNESSIKAGGESIVLKLRNDIWALDMGDNITLTTELLEGITGTESWASILFSTDDVFRRNDSTIEIIIPEASEYYIGDDEIVSVSIPASASANTNYSVIPDPSEFTVVNEDNITFTLAGTLVTGSPTEKDIRDGGQTLEITVWEDLWANQIDDNDDNADSLFTKITGSSFWNSSVTVYDKNNIELNTDDKSKITITFPAAPSYDINIFDTINIDVVAYILKSTNKGTFPIKNAFSINPLPASIITSGNIQDRIYNKEDSIRAGGGEIIFTIEEDEWVPGLGDENVLTFDLINGISGCAEWQTKVKPAILGIDSGATYVNVVDSVLTITLPPVADYNILTPDTLRCEIPASCLVYKSSGTVIADSVIIILPAPAEVFINDTILDELTLNGSVLTLTLEDETFKNPGPVLSNFTTNKSPMIRVGSVFYNSLTSAEITLAFNSDFDEDITDFSIRVNGNQLTGGGSLNSNSILITSQLEPKIASVSIDDSSYIIGDVVKADISLEEEQPSVFGYAGTIAGRSLDSLVYVNNTLYSAYFTVDKDGGDYSDSDDIPVVGLQLNTVTLDGDTLDGEVFTGNVIGSPIIDASKPKINYVQVSGKTKKIGDQIDIIISADGNSYSAVAPTSVNSVDFDSTKVDFENLGNGGYILKYTISEGDFDVAPGALSMKLTLKDQAGNISDSYSFLPANTISIDAHPPQISKIEVSNRVYSIGDTVKIVISTDTDAADYSFDASTEVNGVPYYSTALWDDKTGAGEYTLYYKVKSSDSEVEQGTLNVNVKMTDLAGNSSVSSVVEGNSLAIYTILPTAAVAGNFEICEDDSVLIVVNLSGRWPLTIYSSNGTETTKHDSIMLSPYKFYVSPGEPETYKIDSVVDINGIKNLGTGEAEVIVNDKTNVWFVDLKKSYSLEDDIVELEANKVGGIFTGPGVISTGGYFDPGIADTTNSPHTLYYNYTTDKGCKSVDSAVVFVLGAQGDIFIPNPQVFCDYAGDFTVQASNTADTIGSFRLLNFQQDSVAGLIDNFNNTATVSPKMLEAGVYTVEYEYYAGASLILRENFTIEKVQTPKIGNLATTVFCKNSSKINLSGDPGTAVFSGGPGVIGNIVDGFEFNPESANLGKNTIVLTNTSVNGCVGTDNEALTVNFVPDIQFSLTDSCITSDEIVKFTNDTPDKDSISVWSWTFGDVGSGESNFSPDVDGYHNYTLPRFRTVKLTGTTPHGCTKSLSHDINFGDEPDVTFVWTNECFIDGDSILFISDVTSENTITNFNWVFYNSPTDSSIFDTESVYYTFDSIDNYIVKLNVETNIGCKNEFKDEIVLKPTIQVSEKGFYFEDFESDDGRWSTNTSQELIDGKVLDFNSWDYRRAEFSSDTSKNSKAWYTKVPKDADVKEQSWVISPCFNLRGVEKPMISLDIFRNMEDNEGVVLQYSTDNELSWKNLGTLNQGINWFNDFKITDKPAGQEIGWSGSQTDTVLWTKSIRYLDGVDELKDEPNVRFKLHYGSLHRKDLDTKGFAFDNFKISSRTRMVLMENFTNGTNTGVVNSDKDVNTLYSNNFSDVVKLEYHTDIGGADPFNESNVFVPATRALFYGVNRLPELIIDGGNNGLLTYTTEALIDALNSDVIVRQSLLEPFFDIGLDVDYGENLLTANVQLKALKALGEAERILQVVVYEKIISDVITANKQAEFINVVKDMIPNAAGTAYFNAWEKGESVSEQFRWSYDDDDYIEDMLRVAVFVQNDNTKEIYQATTDNKSLWLTAINEGLSESVGIDLYPNPAGEFVYLKLSSSHNEGFNLEVFDNMGRIIEQREWTAGSQLERIDLDQYTQGFYLIRLRDSKGQIRAIKKLAVVK